ncbi:MAG: hypothetical protein NTX50_13610, partial [Candidatus Sumerlaeota bacterium]|nr:hypothetical protein [Candidatus Sumerlaeota bacterium]
MLAVALLKLVPSPLFSPLLSFSPSASRLKRNWLSAIRRPAFLIALTALACAGALAQPAPPDANPAGERDAAFLNVTGVIPGRGEALSDRLTIVFDGEVGWPESLRAQRPAAAALTTAAAALTTAPAALTTSPTLKGETVFGPNFITFNLGEAPERRVYSVALNPNLQAPDGRKINPRQLRHVVAAFLYEPKDFWTIVDEPNHGVIGIRFPLATRLEALKTFLSARDKSGKETPFTLEASEDPRSFKLTVDGERDWPVTLRIARGLTDAANEFLMARNREYVFSAELNYEVRKLEWASVQEGQQDARIVFSRPVSAEDLQRNLRVRDAASEARPSFSIATTGVQPEHTIRFNLSLSGDVRLRVEIPKEMKSAQGRVMLKDYAGELKHDTPRLYVTKSELVRENQILKIDIEFSHPVAKDQLKRRLQINDLATSAPQEYQLTLIREAETPNTGGEYWIYLPRPDYEDAHLAFVITGDLPGGAGLTLKEEFKKEFDYHAPLLAVSNAVITRAEDADELLLELTLTQAARGDELLKRLKVFDAASSRPVALRLAGNASAALTTHHVRLGLPNYQEASLVVLIAAGLPGPGKLTLAMEYLRRLGYTPPVLAITQLKWTPPEQIEKLQLVMDVSYRIEAGELLRCLKIKNDLDEAPLTFELKTVGKQSSHVIQLPLPKRRHAKVTVEVAAGLAGPGPLRLAETYIRTMKHLPEPPLQITHASGAEHRAKDEEYMYIIFVLNHDAPLETLAPHVTMQPAVAGMRVTKTSNRNFRIDGDWFANTDYTLRIAPGFAYGDNQTLDAPIVFNFKTGRARCFVRFNQEGKYYIPRRPGLDLNLISRCTSETLLSAHRMFPNNLVMALNDMREGGGSDDFIYSWSEEVAM